MYNVAYPPPSPPPPPPSPPTRQTVISSKLQATKARIAMRHAAGEWNPGTYPEKFPGSLEDDLFLCGLSGDGLRPPTSATNLENDKKNAAPQCTLRWHRLSRPELLPGRASRHRQSWLQRPLHSESKSKSPRIDHSRTLFAAFYFKLITLN